MTPLVDGTTVEIHTGIVAPYLVLPEWDRIDFTMQRQQQPEWCWAAVSTSVVSFFDPGTAWTQCQVAAAEMNSNCCEDGSTSVCNHWWYLDKALIRTDTFVEMQGAPASGLGPAPAEIRAGRPLAVRIAWSGGGGHFIVIEGCQRDGNRVALDDPWYGASELPVNSFRSAYQGNGSWTHYYRTKPPA